MSDSIVSNAKECIICKNTAVHKHHIFFGKNRQMSEKYGCWCYLCPKHHNMSRFGVHFDKALDTNLKQKCQKIWEVKYGDRKEFITKFGKSYL